MTTPLDPELAALLPPPSADAPPSLFEMDPVEARAIFDGITLAAPRRDDPDIASEDLTISGDTPLRLRIYRPAGAASGATIVFLHGGGYMLGGLDQMDGEARLLSSLTRAVVVSVDYRLAPENRLPAAHDDAVAALRWARDSAGTLGGDPALVCVAGESAGANLAASAAIAMRDEGIALAAQLLIVPAPDFVALGGVADVDPPHPMLTARDLRAIAALCLPDDPESARRHPFSAAHAGSHAALPPAVVALAGHCPTRAIGLAYADQLRRAGNIVHVHAFPELFHPFFALTQASAAARRAAEEICGDMAALIAQARRPQD